MLLSVEIENGFHRGGKRRLRIVPRPRSSAAISPSLLISIGKQSW
jgi:hypothetical protein